MRVVLDTNVLVAALRSPKGASRQLLRYLAARRLEAYASVAMMLEYEAVLKRPEQLAAFGLTVSEIDTFLDGLALLLRPVTPFFIWRPVLRDPADEQILEATINSPTNIIVTFNRKDFRAAERPFGLELLLPRDALKRMRDDENE